MDVFPKFIIEGDDLILGKVTYHKELANDISQVRGGGMFEYDASTNTFTLFGESSQFGRADLDDVKRCVENGKVYFGPDAMGRLFDDDPTVKMAYKIQGGELVKLRGQFCENAVDKDLTDLVYEITDRGYSEVYRTHPSSPRQEVHYCKDGVRICVVTENGRHFAYVQCTTWIGCDSDKHSLGKLPIVAKTILIPLRAARDNIFEYAEILKNSRELAAGYKPADKSDTEPQYPDVKRKRSGLIWRILGKK